MEKKERKQEARSLAPFIGEKAEAVYTDLGRATRLLELSDAALLSLRTDSVLYEAELVLNDVYGRLSETYAEVAGILDDLITKLDAVMDEEAQG